MQLFSEFGKNVVIIRERPTNGLNNTAITAEAKYFLIPVRTEEKFFESTLQCCQQIEIKPYPSCLGNISK